MAVFTGSPAFQDNGNGTFTVTMGPYAFVYDKQILLDIAAGKYKNPDMLIGAFIDFCLRNNVTLTFSAMATALSAATFKW
jgi:hypothetical protein